MANKYLDLDGLSHFHTKLLASQTPLEDGTAATGSSSSLAREDHRHPHDSSKADLASPAFTGNPTAPTQSTSDDSTKLATTAFVHDVIDGLSTGVTGVKGDAESTYRTGNVNLTPANLGIADFQGAPWAGGRPGVHGLVPAPPQKQSGENPYILLDDGYWHGAWMDLYFDTTADEYKLRIRYMEEDGTTQVTLWETTLPAVTATDRGMMRATDKVKLDGIAAGAEVNVQSDWNQTDTSADDYIKNKPGNATSSAAGLMSATDKDNLDTLVAAGPEANVQSDWNQTNTSADDYIKNKPTLPTIPNGFANVKVGSTTVAADTTADTLELAAGTNVTLTPDATNDKVTVNSDNVALYLYRDNTNNRDEIRLRQGDTLRGAITYSGDSYISITSDGSAAPESIALSLNDLPASKITSGTFSADRIPGLDAAKIISGTLGTSRIPSLAASKITSGTFDVARIPNLDASKINSGTLGAARIPSLDASKIASGTIDAARLPSYVDDVIEAYPVSGSTALSAGWLSKTSGGSALTPETGKIYVLMADSGDYSANDMFRWGGSTYVKLSDGAGFSRITETEINALFA